MKFFSDFFRPPPGPAFRLDSPTSASPLRELFQPCQSRISLDCGCKGRNFHIPLQTFPRLFFEYFRIVFHSRLWNRRLSGNIFFVSFPSPSFIPPFSLPPPLHEVEKMVSPSLTRQFPPLNLLMLRKLLPVRDG